MSDSTRRGFLAVAGVGAAATVAVAAAPSAGAATPDGAAKPERVSLPKGVEGSMAAYIHDLKAAEVSVMVEGREIVVRDKELVARLAHAFHTAAASARSTSA